MQSPLEILQKAKSRKTSEEELVMVHHILMKEYGWIPFEEFKTLPLPTVKNLLDVIVKQRKEEKKVSERRHR